MKRPGSKKAARREIFVLTPEEKRTISFVVIMFLPGGLWSLFTRKRKAA